MKFALILIALVLMNMALADHEHKNVNGVNISFELNQTNDTIIDQGDGINGSLTIKTFDGFATVSISRYPRPLSINSTWIQDSISAYRAGKTAASPIDIDKNHGIFWIINSGYPEYEVSYFPGLAAGKAIIKVTIDSTMPLYATADLLRTIHVTIGEAAIYVCVNNWKVLFPL